MWTFMTDVVSIRGYWGMFMTDVVSIRGYWGVYVSHLYMGDTGGFVNQY